MENLSLTMMRMSKTQLSAGLPSSKNLHAAFRSPAEAASPSSRVTPTTASHPTEEPKVTSPTNSGTAQQSPLAGGRLFPSDSDSYILRVAQSRRSAAALQTHAAHSAALDRVFAKIKYLNRAGTDPSTSEAADVIKSMPDEEPAAVSVDQIIGSAFGDLFKAAQATNERQTKQANVLMHRQCAAALRNLAGREGAEFAMLERGVVRVLDQLCTVSDRATLQNCALCLRNLSCVQSIRRRMTDDGAVTSLVHLSSVIDPLILEDVSVAICNLLHDPMCEPTVAFKGGTNALLSTCKSLLELHTITIGAIADAPRGTYGRRQHKKRLHQIELAMWAASCGLYNLSCNPEQHARLIETEALATITSLLRSSIPRVQQETIRLLYNLSSKSWNRRQLFTVQLVQNLYHYCQDELRWAEWSKVHMSVLQKERTALEQEASAAGGVLPGGHGRLELLIRRQEEAVLRIQRRETVWQHMVLMVGNVMVAALDITRRSQYSDGRTSNVQSTQNGLGDEQGGVDGQQGHGCGTDADAVADTSLLGMSSPGQRDPSEGGGGTALAPASSAIHGPLWAREQLSHPPPAVARIWVYFGTEVVHSVADNCRLKVTRRWASEVLALLAGNVHCCRRLVTLGSVRHVAYVLQAADVHVQQSALFALLRLVQLPFALGELVDNHCSRFVQGLGARCREKIVSWLSPRVQRHQTALQQAQAAKDATAAAALLYDGEAVRSQGGTREPENHVTVYLCMCMLASLAQSTAADEESARSLLEQAAYLCVFLVRWSNVLLPQACTTLVHLTLNSLTCELLVGAGLLRAIAYRFRHLETLDPDTAVHLTRVLHQLAVRTGSHRSSILFMTSAESHHGSLADTGVSVAEMSQTDIEQMCSNSPVAPSDMHMSVLRLIQEVFVGPTGEKLTAKTGRTSPRAKQREQRTSAAEHAQARGIADVDGSGERPAEITAATLLSRIDSAVQMSAEGARECESAGGEPSSSSAAPQESFVARARRLREAEATSRESLEAGSREGGAAAVRFVRLQSGHTATHVASMVRRSCRLIRRLCDFTPMQTFLVQEGIVPLIRHIARRCTRDDCKQLVEAIEMLARDAQLRDALLAAGTVSILVSMSQVNDTAVKRGVLQSLYWLSHTTRREHNVVREGGVSSLMMAALFQLDRLDAKYLCAAALYNLLGSGRARHALVDTGVVWALLRLSHADHDAIKTLCARAVSNLLCYSAFRRKVLANKGLTALVYLSRTGSLETRVQCATSLRQLTQYTQLLHMMVNEGAIAALCDIGLDSSIPPVALRDACAALRNISCIEAGCTHMLLHEEGKRIRDIIALATSRVEGRGGAGGGRPSVGDKLMYEEAVTNACTALINCWTIDNTYACFAEPPEPADITRQLQQLLRADAPFLRAMEPVNATTGTAASTRARPTHNSTNRAGDGKLGEQGSTGRPLGRDSVLSLRTQAEALALEEPTHVAQTAVGRLAGSTKHSRGRDGMTAHSPRRSPRPGGAGLGPTSRGHRSLSPRYGGSHEDAGGRASTAGQEDGGAADPELGAKQQAALFAALAGVYGATEVQHSVHVLAAALRNVRSESARSTAAMLVFNWGISRALEYSASAPVPPTLPHRMTNLMRTQQREEFIDACQVWGEHLIATAVLLSDLLWGNADSSTSHTSLGGNQTTAAGAGRVTGTGRTDVRARRNSADTPDASQSRQPSSSAGPAISIDTGTGRSEVGSVQLSQRWACAAACRLAGVRVMQSIIWDAEFPAFMATNASAICHQKPELLREVAVAFCALTFFAMLEATEEETEEETGVPQAKTRPSQRPADDSDKPSTPVPRNRATAAALASTRPPAQPRGGTAPPAAPRATNAVPHIGHSRLSERLLQAGSGTRLQSRLRSRESSGIAAGVDSVVDAAFELRPNRAGDTEPVFVGRSRAGVRGGDSDGDSRGQYMDHQQRQYQSLVDAVVPPEHNANAPEELLDDDGPCLKQPLLDAVRQLCDMGAALLQVSRDVHSKYHSLIDQLLITPSAGNALPRDHPLYNEEAAKSIRPSPSPTARLPSEAYLHPHPPTAPSSPGYISGFSPRMISSPRWGVTQLHRARVRNDTFMAILNGGQALLRAYRNLLSRCIEHPWGPNASGTGRTGPVTEQSGQQAALHELAVHFFLHPAGTADVLIQLCETSIVASAVYMCQGAATKSASTAPQPNMEHTFQSVGGSFGQPAPPKKQADSRPAITTSAHDSTKPDTTGLRQAQYREEARRGMRLQQEQALDDASLVLAGLADVACFACRRRLVSTLDRRFTSMILELKSALLALAAVPRSECMLSASSAIRIISNEQQLATMLSRDVPLLRALEKLVQHGDEDVRRQCAAALDALSLANSHEGTQGAARDRLREVSSMPSPCRQSLSPAAGGSATACPAPRLLSAAILSIHMRRMASTADGLLSSDLHVRSSETGTSKRSAAGSKTDHAIMDAVVGLLSSQQRQAQQQSGAQKQPGTTAQGAAGRVTVSANPQKVAPESTSMASMLSGSSGVGTGSFHESRGGMGVHFRPNVVFNRGRRRSNASLHVEYMQKAMSKQIVGAVLERLASCRIPPRQPGVPALAPPLHTQHAIALDELSTRSGAAALHDSQPMLRSPRHATAGRSPRGGTGAAHTPTGRGRSATEAHVSLIASPPPVPAPVDHSRSLVRPAPLHLLFQPYLLYIYMSSQFLYRVSPTAKTARAAGRPTAGSSAEPDTPRDGHSSGLQRRGERSGVSPRLGEREHSGSAMQHSPSDIRRFLSVRHLRTDLLRLAADDVKDPNANAIAPRVYSRGSRRDCSSDDSHSDTDDDSGPVITVETMRPKRSFGSLSHMRSSLRVSPTHQQSSLPRRASVGVMQRNSLRRTRSRDQRRMEAVAGGGGGGVGAGLPSVLEPTAPVADSTESSVAVSRDAVRVLPTREATTVSRRPRSGTEDSSKYSADEDWVTDASDTTVMLISDSSALDQGLATGALGTTRPSFSGTVHSTRADGVDGGVTVVWSKHTVPDAVLSLSFTAAEGVEAGHIRSAGFSASRAYLCTSPTVRSAAEAERQTLSNLQQQCAPPASINYNVSDDSPAGTRTVGQGLTSSGPATGGLVSLNGVRVGESMEAVGVAVDVPIRFAIEGALAMLWSFERSTAQQQAILQREQTAQIMMGILPSPTAAADRGPSVFAALEEPSWVLTAKYGPHGRRQVLRRPQAGGHSSTDHSNGSAVGGRGFVRGRRLSSGSMAGSTVGRRASLTTIDDGMVFPVIRISIRKKRTEQSRATSGNADSGGGAEPAPASASAEPGGPTARTSVSPDLTRSRPARRYSVVSAVSSLYSMPVMPSTGQELRTEQISSDSEDDAGLAGEGDAPVGAEDPALVAATYSSNVRMLDLVGGSDRGAHFDAMLDTIMARESTRRGKERSAASAASSASSAAEGTAERGGGDDPEAGTALDFGRARRGHSAESGARNIKPFQNAGNDQAMSPRQRRRRARLSALLGVGGAGSSAASTIGDPEDMDIWSSDSDMQLGWPRGMAEGVAEAEQIVADRQLRTLTKRLRTRPEPESWSGPQNVRSFSPGGAYSGDESGDAEESDIVPPAKGVDHWAQSTVTPVKLGHLRPPSSSDSDDGETRPPTSKDLAAYIGSTLSRGVQSEEKAQLVLTRGTGFASTRGPRQPATARAAPPLGVTHTFAFPKPPQSVPSSADGVPAFHAAYRSSLAPGAITKAQHVPEAGKQLLAAQQAITQRAVDALMMFRNPEQGIRRRVRNAARRTAARRKLKRAILVTRAVTTARRRHESGGNDGSNQAIASAESRMRDLYREQIKAASQSTQAENVTPFKRGSRAAGRRMGESKLESEGKVVEQASPGPKKLTKRAKRRLRRKQRREAEARLQALAAPRKLPLPQPVPPPIEEAVGTRTRETKPSTTTLLSPYGSVQSLVTAAPRRPLATAKSMGSAGGAQLRSSPRPPDQSPGPLLPHLTPTIANAQPLGAGPEPMLLGSPRLTQAAARGSGVSRPIPSSPRSPRQPGALAPTPVRRTYRKRHPGSPIRLQQVQSESTVAASDSRVRKRGDKKAATAASPQGRQRQRRVVLSSTSSEPADPTVAGSSRASIQSGSCLLSSPFRAPIPRRPTKPRPKQDPTHQNAGKEASVRPATEV